MTDVSTTDAAPQTKGREAVPEALLQAAAELLGEVGPSRMSVRDIAERAGVNKGQIHHYFGGKQALITEAFRHLVQVHYDKAMPCADITNPQHAPLSDQPDEPYWSALTRLVIDGDLQTASLEFREGLSVPQSILERGAEIRGLDAPDDRLRSGFAAAMAMELGWSAFAPHILAAVGAADDPELIERIRCRLTELVLEVIRA